MQEKVSILFAGEAAKLLEEGNSAAALQLCKTAMKTYRDYPMGYLMTALASYEEDNRDSAFDYIEKGLTKFPNYLPLLNFRHLVEDSAIIAAITAEYNYEKITTVEDSEQSEPDLNAEKRNATGEYSDRNEDTMDEKPNFLRLVNTVDKAERIDNQLRADNPALIPGLAFTPLRATRRQQFSDYASQSLRFPDFYNPLDYDNNDKIDEEELENDKEIYATDTMATILESQQAFEEAIKIYSILKEISPDKVEYYNKKIEEISKKLKN